MLSGLCCGIAAIMIVSRTTTGSRTHGTLYELDAIAAVIIGGTLLTGGRGTLIGSILGVLVFTTITNLFMLNNLATEVQNIAKGLIIVAAVLLQSRAPDRSSLRHRLTAPAEGVTTMSDVPSTLSRCPARAAASCSARSALGAGAALSRLHQQRPRPPRRRPGTRPPPPPAATTPRPGTAVTIGFSAPAADHGWIAAIAKNAQAAGRPVLRRRPSSRSSRPTTSTSRSPPSRR